MPEIRNDAAIMTALGRQMSRAVQRQAVAAGNLANLDTPDYRTKEIRFDDALDHELSGARLLATNPHHIGGTVVDAQRSEPAEVADLPTRRDGNNVQLDRELLSMGRAGSDFTAAQTIMAARFRLIRYAINEGR